MLFQLLVDSYFENVWCFFSRYNKVLWLFFSIFYLYTLCTFYYLCKLCLYDLFSSVFLDVNELAFMLYLLFLICCLFFGSEANLQYEYFPPVKFTLAL